MQEKIGNSYFPLLDYLRICAILGVVVHHSPFIPLDSFVFSVFRFGPLGVDLFFVLSGFLIANQLFLKIKQKGEFSLKDFYIRRALRIWPNYFVLLALFLMVGYSFNIPDYKIKPLINYFTLTQNYISSFTQFTVSWSLCVEEHFYLIFPLILYVLNKKGLKKTHSVSVIVFFIMLGIFFRTNYWYQYRPDLHFDLNNHFHSFYYLTHMRLDGLIIGVSVAALYNYSQSWVKLDGKRIILFVVSLLILGFSLVVFPRIVGDSQSVLIYSLSGVLYSLSFGLMVLSCVYNKGHFKSHFHMTIPFFSNLSYALYLTHMESFKLLGYFGISQRSFINLFISILLCVGVSIIVYLVIEKPFQKLKNRFVS